MKIVKLRESEELLHELGPSPRVLIIWIFTKVLLWSIGFGIVFFWIAAMTFGVLGVGEKIEADTAVGIMGYISASVFVVSLGLSFVYAVLLRRTYHYYITNQRCVFVGGILRYRERSVPYHKVTDVELSINIFERIFGMSSVRIFTPGTGSSRSWGPWGSSQAPELCFEGLTDSEEPSESINVMVRDSKDARHT